MDKFPDKGIRKNYFILKGFQLRYGIVIFITAFIVSIISVWTTYITTWREVSNNLKNARFAERIYDVYDRQQDETTRTETVNSIFTVEFSEIFDKVSSSLMLRLLIGSLVLFVLSIFVSHKIAGPVFRMENVAHSIIEGNLSVELNSLRAGDELAQLAKAINGAIIKLRLLMEKYREMAMKLTELASKIAVYTEGGEIASGESTKLIKELEVVSNQLVKEMNYFKTKGKSPTTTDDENNNKKISHWPN